MIERMREILIEIRQRLRHNKGRIQYKDGWWRFEYMHFEGIEHEVHDDYIIIRPAGWREAEEQDE